MNLMIQLNVGAVVRLFLPVLILCWSGSEAQAESRQMVVAGTIRHVATDKWSVIEDATHEPINIAAVSVDKGVLVIKFPFTARVIHTFIAVPDDSLALSGYLVGSSVRPDQASILLSRTRKGEVEPVDAGSLDEPYGNIWIYGLFSVPD